LTIHQERKFMTRFTGAFLLAAALAAVTPAHAQESRATEGTVVVTIIPGGATYFTEGKDLKGPSFSNYDLGGGVAANFNRYVGVEGEVSGKLGISQSLGTLIPDVKTPNMLNYSGNLVISAPSRSVIPYATAGVGGLSVFEKASLGITETETFLTGNVGGGVKWYSGRWGLRGDYRFIAVQSKDDAPEFFGRETRYGHRFYGAVLVNLGR
jgi:Outer membrane protein beta-barrel domain